MKEIILGFITSFFVVLLATPSLIKVAKLKRLVDEPGDERKLHRNSVPTIGGIIIFAATIFAYVLWFPSENTSFFGTSYSFSVAVSNLKYIVAATILLFFTGVKDDIIGVAPVKKLISHILVGFILVVMGDIRIIGMHDIFWVDELPYWASIFLSVFTYVVVVNAFNLIDGVDGLAGGIGFIASCFFGVWFAFTDQMTLSLLSFVLAGSIGAFLLFNFSPAKIFMGDSGSLFIGAIMFVLAVKCAETPLSKLPAMLEQVSPPVFAMAVLSYPLSDTLRVFFYRTLKGISPFSADKNHVHHKLLLRGLSHAQTSLVLYGASVVVCLASVFLARFEPTLAFVSMFAFSLIVYNILAINRKAAVA